MTENKNSFEVNLDKENRWVKLAEQTLWHDLKRIYNKKVDAAVVHLRVLGFGTQERIQQTLVAQMGTVQPAAAVDRHADGLVGGRAWSSAMVDR